MYLPPGDGTLKTLYTAPYAFVNKDLAAIYGVAPPATAFGKVMLDPTQRAGIFTQVSFLGGIEDTVADNPIYRGLAVYTKALCGTMKGPDFMPPPVNFIAGATTRKSYDTHGQMACASMCHSVFDPPGFAFENYDGVGRWRSNDESANPIDASGSLPDGSKFAGVAGLQQALLSHPESFVTTLSEKLLTYGLGRGVGSYDAPAVRKIVRESQAKDFRFSSVILGVVNSTPFQMRRSQ